MNIYFSFYINIIIAAHCVLLSAQNTISGTDEENCTAPGCHSDILDQQFKHAAAQDDCSACHEASGESHPQSEGDEYTLSETQPDLCYQCHTEKNTQPNIHVPVADGECTTCHMVHSSEFSHLLQAPMRDICMECHEIGLESDTLHVMHGRSLDKSGCTVCHNPHQSENESLFRVSPNNLCAQCHKKYIEFKGSNINAVSAKVSTMETIHTPVEEGCLSCHLLHSSQNKYLLSSSFPAKIYTDQNADNFGLCFECHDSELISTEITSESTEFRNGNQNLHYLHVMKKKGRNCILCHDVHASDQLYLISDHVNYGQWEMPMNYRETEKGGSCQPGCHPAYEYSRD